MYTDMCMDMHTTDLLSCSKLNLQPSVRVHEFDGNRVLCARQCTVLQVAYAHIYTHHVLDSWVVPGYASPLH